jgi:dipeptide/tripeptide permease
MAELYKNPIIHGILAGALTLGIMYYFYIVEKKSKDKKRRKFKIDVIPILIVGIVTWFVSNTYFNSINSFFNGHITGNTPPQVTGGMSTLPAFPIKNFNIGTDIAQSAPIGIANTKVNIFDQLNTIPELGNIF